MSQEQVVNAHEDGNNHETSETAENTIIANGPSYEHEVVDEKDLSSVVQGTAETLLSKLEETVAATSISNRKLPFGKQMNFNKKGNASI